MQPTHLHCVREVVQPKRVALLRDTARVHEDISHLTQAVVLNAERHFLGCPMRQYPSNHPICVLLPIDHGGVGIPEQSWPIRKLPDALVHDPTSIPQIIACFSSQLALQSQSVHAGTDLRAPPRDIPCGADRAGGGKASEPETGVASSARK